MSAPQQQELHVAILVISDTAAQDPATDKCVDALTAVLQQNANWSPVITSRIVADGIASVQQALLSWTDTFDNSPSLIVTSGGTGFAVKDTTPEAVTPLLHRPAPGLVHAMLTASLQVTPFAMMARPVAGVRNQTLIITLPGSPKGACENLESIMRLLPHACVQVRGADSRALHAPGLAQLEKEAGVSGNAAADSSRTNLSAGHQHSHQHGHGHGHGHSHGHGHGHGHGHHAPRPHTTPSDRPKPLSNDPSAGPAHRARESPYPMLSVPKALELISSTVPQPESVLVPVNESLVGSVLSRDVTAVESVPAFRASIVDGYAVRCDSNGKNTKGVFDVAFASHAKAGSDAGIPELEQGQVARITTGAPLPPGADGVVMVEDTVVKKWASDTQEEEQVEILTDQVKAGENVREAGSDVRAGDTVMRAGEGVTAIGGEFGLLASVGAKEVETYRKPVVGILSTGDEIVPHDRPGGLKLGEVRDTNRPTLLTAVRASGFEAIDLGIAADKAHALESTLRSALSKVDVLISSGGVSMGELDLLKPTIERSLGGTIHFGRVSMKPGKPTTFATVPATNIKDPISGIRDGGTGGWPEKVIFSLPGNPASAVVTYMLFVLPALHRMSGVEPVGLPRVNVRLDTDVQCDKSREEYHRVVCVGREDGLWATSTGGQRSSRIGSFKGANALVKLPAGGGTISRGSQVEALLMGAIGGIAL